MTSIQVLIPKNPKKLPKNTKSPKNELPRSRAAKYQRGLKAILYWKGTRRFPFQTNPFLVFHPAAELRGILLIKVFELAPPATQTDLLKNFKEEDMKGITVMSVEKMVAEFLKGLSKDQYEICPGQSNQLKFMNRFFPNFILKQMSKTVDAMHAE